MSGSRPWLRFGARCAQTVGSACVTSVCWVVWALLSTTLVGLALIYFRHEITVPDFLLRRIERKLEFAQLSARFGRTAFDPSGNLVLEEVRVFGAGIAEPLAQATAVRVRVDIWAVLGGGFDVNEIEVVNLRLDCPAPVSPSGTSEPVVDGLFGTLTRQGNDFDLGQAVCKAGRVLVTVRGHWSARPGRGPARNLPRDLVRSYCQFSRRAAETLRLTEQLESPRLRLAVTATEGQPWRTHVELSAARVDLPGANVLEGLRVAGDVAWTRGAAVTVAAVAEAERASVGESVSVERPWIRARGRLEAQPWRWAGEPVQFCAARVARGADAVDFPSGSLAVDALPLAQGEFMALVHGSPVAVAGTTDWTSRTAAARVGATLSPALLNDATKRAAAWRRSKVLARMDFQEPVRIDGTVRLAPGWKIEEARLAARVGAAEVYGVALQESYAEVWTDGRRLRADPAVLVRAGAHVRGSYEMEFATLDYRFLLGGHFFPDSITPWIGAGWGRFWKDFAFGAAPPLADAAIAGRWRTPRFNSYYGWADVPSVTLRGVPLDRVQATFFIRPEHYDIIDFAARRGALQASGSFVRDDDPRHENGAPRLPLAVAFDVRSTLPLADGARLFGEEGRRTVEPYVFVQPPRLEARGRVRWDENGMHDDIAATVTAPGTLYFHHFPVEEPRIAFTLKEGVVDVPQIEAKVGGGRLTGKSRVTGPRQARQLTVEGKLEGANLEETTTLWRNYRLKTAPPEAPALPAPHHFGKDGRLDLRVQAAGPLDNLMGLHGEGSVEIEHAELGGVALFGPLAVKFNAGRASFQIEEDKLNFTKLRLSGPVAALEGKGRYAMPTSGLDFKVRLLPFRENAFPVFSLLGLVLEPITFWLDVKLVGTMAKPDWYFMAGPTNLLGLKPEPVVAPPRPGPTKAPAAAEPLAPLAVPPESS